MSPEPVDQTKGAAPLLTVATTLVSTAVNGPGRRFVLWLQGCPLRCSGCFNPEYWSETGGYTISAANVLAHLQTLTDIEGITLTGGEPFAQAPALLPLVEAVQGAGLSIVCYTGYVLEDLRQGAITGALDLLNRVDILIDGPYDAGQNAPLLWRGSRNQRVLFLSERYRHLEPLAALVGRRQAELQIGTTELHITGIFDTLIWKRLQAKLRN